MRNTDRRRVSPYATTQWSVCHPMRHFLRQNAWSFRCAHFADLVGLAHINRPEEVPTYTVSGG